MSSSTRTATKTSTAAETTTTTKKGGAGGGESAIISPSTTTSSTSPTSPRQHRGPLTRKRAASINVEEANQQHSQQQARKTSISDGGSSAGGASSATSSSGPGSAGLPPSETGGRGGSPRHIDAKDICLCTPAPKVPRPRNAFILYRQAHQAQVVATHPGSANPEISKIIGDRWKQEPEDEKARWRRLAEEEKRQHQQKYPDYRYQPRRGNKGGQGGTGSNGGNGGGRSGSGTPGTPLLGAGEDPGRCPKCGGRYIATPRTPSTPFVGAGGSTPTIARSATMSAFVKGSGGGGYGDRDRADRGSRDRDQDMIDPTLRHHHQGYGGGTPYSTPTTSHPRDQHWGGAGYQYPPPPPSQQYQDHHRLQDIAEEHGRDGRMSPPSHKRPRLGSVGTINTGGAASYREDHNRYYRNDGHQALPSPALSSSQHNPRQHHPSSYARQPPTPRGVSFPPQPAPPGPPTPALTVGYARQHQQQQHGSGGGHPPPLPGASSITSGGGGSSNMGPPPRPHPQQQQPYSATRGEILPPLSAIANEHPHTAGGPRLAPMHSLHVQTQHLSRGSEAYASQPTSALDTPVLGGGGGGAGVTGLGIHYPPPSSARPGGGGEPQSAVSQYQPDVVGGPRRGSLGDTHAAHAPAAAGRRPVDEAQLSVQAMVMSINYQSKLEVLDKIRPPLSPSLPLPSEGGKAGGGAPFVRGPIIAVEGPDEYYLRLVGKVVEKAIRNLADSYELRVWDRPSMGGGDETKKGDEKIGAAASTQEQHGAAVSAPASRSGSIASIKPAGGGDAEGISSNPFAVYLQTMLEWHAKSAEMVKFVTNPPTSSSSSTSTVLGKRAREPSTSSASSSASDRPVMSSNADAADAAAAAAPPNATTTTTMTTTTTNKLPVALLPGGFSLTEADRFACTIPIADSYAPIDHWQWTATLWRGTVSPDLVVYARKAPPPFEGGAFGFRHNLPQPQPVEQKSPGLMVVRVGDTKEQVQKMERNVAFQIEEWVRDASWLRRPSAFGVEGHPY